MRFDLNLKQLKVFYFVAKHLSFTEAARELFITQPAVTMQVDALEKYCETKLFLRKRGALELTEAGATLYGYAEQIMHLAFEAEQALAVLKDNPRGVLRIGTTKTFARYLLPPFVMQFHDAFPEIRIQLDEGSSEEMAMSIVYGRNDIAVVGKPPEDDRLEWQPFPGSETTPLVLVVQPDHPLAGRDRVTLEEIGEQPLVLREKGSGTRERILECFQRKGITPRVLLEAGNVGFIKDLVCRGAGVTILTITGLEEDIAGGTLKAIPVDEENFVVEIAVVTGRDAYRPLAVQTFLDFLLGGRAPGCFAAPREPNRPGHPSAG